MLVSSCMNRLHIISAMLTSPFNSGCGLNNKGDDGAETSMCAGATELAKSGREQATTIVLYIYIDEHCDGSIYVI